MEYVYVTVGFKRASSVPKSVHLPEKESNFVSGFLNFLADFQDFPNKSSKH